MLGNLFRFAFNLQFAESSLKSSLTLMLNYLLFLSH